MLLHHKTFGSGPDFVILHGLFGMLDNWRTIARQLAERYTITLADLRNHGRSFHADEMDYDLMAEDVATLLESLEIDECILLGHSMGGKVAMQTALTYPDLVSKLIVVDMTPREYQPGHTDVFAALTALDLTTIADRKDAAPSMSRHMPDLGVQLFLLKNLARDPAGGYRWRMNLPVIQGSYDKLIAAVGKLGDTFDGPTLFLRGGKSDYLQEEDWPMIAHLFPQAQLATVAEAGHWVHAERPEELLAEVADFLGQTT
jgi:pimeloyl-ACP methyl ester carboxylesterase